MKNWFWVYALCAFFTFGCAGIERNCSADCASNLGADWVIVQYTATGEPMGCWELHGVSVANEEGSDGIYWLSEDGHLVHISNFYNRVQVEGAKWASAYEELGMMRDQCALVRAIAIDP